MLAGLLACSWIYVPWLFGAIFGQDTRSPRPGFIIMVLLFMSVMGFIWLLDEIWEITGADIRGSARRRTPTEGKSARLLPPAG
jgi:hypothetical protein